MRAHVESTRRPEVVGGLGGFGGAFAIPAGYREPLLVASTDGVGTKTAIAAALGRFDTIGIDLVAMCADDVVCCGAEPLAFLDYVAVGRVVPGMGRRARRLGRGRLSRGGLRARRRRDGRASGADGGRRVRPVRAAASASSSEPTSSTGRAVRAGDAILGLAASGLHSNGFSLVRTLIAEWDLDLAEPYQARLRRSLGDAETEAAVTAAPNEAMATLGEVLLTPTRIYARAVLGARAAVRAAGPRPARHRPHHRRRAARQRAAGAARRPGGPSRPGPLADAVGHAPVRRARRSRRRRAARDVQRWARDGHRRCPRRRRPRSSSTAAEHGIAATVVGEVVDARRRPVPATSRERWSRSHDHARDTSAGPTTGRDGRVSDPRRIAVGVSGAGSNLRALAAAADRGELGGDDRPGLRRSRRARRSTGRPSRGSRRRSSPAATTRRSPATLARRRAGRRRPGRLHADRRAAPCSPRSRAGSSTRIRRSCRRSRVRTPSTTRWRTA